ncbi:LytR/AlgR family response regulator transcription factor [Hyphobacterium sp.]|uniref:LytR/AlgR family response regulator transcription factor n=1 Tax=Hyphobacterium sp. TaxID=2004662 RepID=UPI0037496A8A
MSTPRLSLVLSSDADNREMFRSFLGRACDVTTAPLHLTGQLVATMVETSRIDGVVIFAADADFETIALAKQVDTRGIPYMLALEKCASAQVLFELASREFILISQERAQIEATITRFLSYLTNPAQNYRNPAPRAAELPGDIWVRQGYADRKIPLNEIRSISADKDYAVIELPNASLLVRATLSTLEDELGAQDFIRIHRSHIIPAHRIQEVKNVTRHSHQVLLDDGEAFPVGKTYWPRVRRRFRGQTRRQAARSG